MESGSSRGRQEVRCVTRWSNTLEQGSAVDWAAWEAARTLAMVATSVPQPIFSPKAAASVSLPNMMSV